MGCLQFCLDITIYVDCYALLGSETQPLTVTLTQRESLASHIHAECTDLNAFGFFRN